MVFADRTLDGGDALAVLGGGESGLAAATGGHLDPDEAAPTGGGWAAGSAVSTRQRRPESGAIRGMPGDAPRRAGSRLEERVSAPRFRVVVMRGWAREAP